MRASQRSLRLVLTCAPAVLAGALGSLHCGGGSFSTPSSDAGVDSGVDATEDNPGLGVDVITLTDAEAGVPDGADGSSDAGCPSPTTLDCNGTCVDPTQPAHCGTCNTVCEGGTPECSGGTCSSGCSGTTPTNCSGPCVNEQADPNNCGGCGAQCGIVANGSPACVAGSDGGPTCGASCAPGSGYHGAGPGCDSTCLPNTDDPSTDPCVVANAYGTFVSP